MQRRGQQINQLEQLAAACARLTFPGALAERRVLHFIDNTCALSASVHGYANAADMAAFVNALHLSDAVMGVDAWYEWVPSKANISDWASRPDLFHKIPASARKVPMRLPFLVDFFDLPS